MATGMKWWVDSMWGYLVCFLFSIPLATAPSSHLPFAGVMELRCLDELHPTLTILLWNDGSLVWLLSI